MTQMSFFDIRRIQQLEAYVMGWIMTNALVLYIKDNTLDKRQWLIQRNISQSSNIETKSVSKQEMNYLMQNVKWT